jgi:hypothetical protein
MNIASYADELKSQAEMVITRPSDFLSHVSKKALHITNMDSRLAYTPDLREISTWLFDLRIRSAKETKGA